MVKYSPNALTTNWSVESRTFEADDFLEEFSIESLNEIVELRLQGRDDKADELQRQFNAFMEDVYEDVPPVKEFFK